MSRFLVRAYQGAFSRGPGYEPHPRGALFDESGTAGYYIDYRAKLSTREHRPEAKLSPTETAQLALGWHERAMHGDTVAEDRFLAVCDELRASAVRVAGGLAWPYMTKLAKYPLPQPWYSGMAQGQIASVFVRAWRRTGDDRFADLARQAIVLLADDPAFAGLVSRSSLGPVIEECAPSRPPSRILNGWIFGLWGVRDVALALDDHRCARLESATTECLAASLDLYDTGWWTRYSLFPHRRFDLAKPFYHRLHIVQVNIMYDLTGVETFADASRRWESYATRLGAARAVASKVPFAIRTRAWQSR